MLKPINIITGAATGMLAAAALTACSDVDSPSLAEQTDVNVILTIDRSTHGSRTAFTPNDEGGLDAVWTDGDLLVVSTQQGGYLGTLTLTDGVGEQLGTFTGTISGVTDGEQPLRLSYLGTNYHQTSNPGTTHSFRLDNNGSLTDPVNSGTLAVQPAADIMKRDITLTVANTQIRHDETIDMDRLMSFGHFKVNDTHGATTVTVSGTAIAPALNYSFATAAVTRAAGATTVDIAAGTAGSLGVTLATDGTFNVPVFPGPASALTFTLTGTDGFTYTATLPAKNAIPAGHYLNADGSPIELDLAKQDVPDYPGYENEDPRNPLHKFAKYNLTRTGDGEVTNRFVDSETENGALYQWGRNYGFEDASGTYPASNITVSGDFTNYFEIMSDFEWVDYNGNPATSTSNRYSRLFNYYTYNPNNNWLITGTGAYYDYGTTTVDVSRNYSYASVIQNQQTKYFFDASNSRSGDYWITSEFGEGGNNWYERAKKCGYSRTNPCPDKWRLPTEQDFQEICPKQMPSYSGSLRDLITAKAQPEVREDRNGVKYAIRWLNYGSYLQIEAIVVDENFTDANLNSILWDQDTRVVKRKFPFTGDITPFFTKDERVFIYGDIWIAIPYGLGTFQPMDRGSLYNGNSWLQIYPAKNYNRALGAYWIGDTGKSFQFLDNSLADDRKSSTIDIRTTDAETALAIRPVMDIP